MGAIESGHWETFELGFWHPFGQHGRTASAIIRRKRGEIERNGWTLWSFQYRTTETLDAWHRQLSGVRGSVFVFCSKGRSGVDTDAVGSKTIDCRHYKLVGEQHWQAVPSAFRVVQPFNRGKSLASAFVVGRVYYPVQHFKRSTAQWFKKAKWYDKIPSRPEYLIRRGGEVLMPDVGAVLELRAPYLAHVRR
jgi:hypothetical protein